MWKQILYLSCLVVAGCSDIADREYPEPQPAPAAATDSQATVQTRNLLGNLRSIAENGGTLFGHQCSSLYGIGWSGDADRSDVKSICGDYPAIMGWDLAQIELGQEANIDGDKFDDIRGRILEAYARGGVTTVGWHTTQPRYRRHGLGRNCRRRTDYSRRRPARKILRLAGQGCRFHALAQDC